MQKLNLFSLEEKLAELHKQIFTPQDLILLFEVKKRAVEGFLSYNVAKNKIVHLRKGFYSLKKNYLSPYLIANKIYQPSYISFETALSYYGLIPETVYTMTSATPKSTREFEVSGIVYSYQTIKKDAFTGYVLQTIEDNKIYIATPEKAMADYCYFMLLGKRSWNDRFDLKKINTSKLKEYLKLFKKERLVQVVRRYISNI